MRCEPPTTTPPHCWEAANKPQPAAAGVKPSKVEASLESARAEQKAVAPAPATVATPPPASEPGLTPAFAASAVPRRNSCPPRRSLKEAEATKWKSAALVADGAENPTEARVRAATGINRPRTILVAGGSVERPARGVDRRSLCRIGDSGDCFWRTEEGMWCFSLIDGVLPIVFLGVGSSSPGVIVALYGIVRGAAEVSGGLRRRRRHESAHLRWRAKLGVTVAEYSAGDRPRVEFYYKMGIHARRCRGVGLGALRAGRREAFGQAKGAQQDFADLQDIFDRVQPPLTPAEQQAATRRAAPQRYGAPTCSRKDGAVAAVDAAMARGATLGGVVCALENASRRMPEEQPDGPPTPTARIFIGRHVQQSDRRLPYHPSASTQNTGCEYALVRSRRGTPNGPTPANVRLQNRKISPQISATAAGRLHVYGVPAHTVVENTQ